MKNISSKVVLGITGLPGAGKSTFSEILSKMLINKNVSCQIIAVSDLIKAEVINRNWPLDRFNIHKVGAQMRKSKGDGYWITKLLSRIDEYEKHDVLIIDGIRTPGELLVLREQLQHMFMHCCPA